MTSTSTEPVPDSFIGEAGNGSESCPRLLPLDGLSVFNMGFGMPAALVSKMLFELGATVMRVSSGETDPFEAIYPAYTSWRMHEVSVNQGDEDEMLSSVDICIIGGEDHPSINRRRDAQALAARHLRLIVIDIAAYPAGYADGRPGVDILAQARSGLAFEHYADRPIMIGFKPSQYGAVLNGMTGILSALIEREASGRGQLVTTSMLEGAMLWGSGLWQQVERASPATEFVSPKNVRALIFQCRDGEYIHIAFGTPGVVEMTYQVLGIVDPVPDGNGLAFPMDDPDNFFGQIDVLSRYVAQWDSAALQAALNAAGVPIERVGKPGDCWSHPQCAVNDVLRDSNRGGRMLGNMLMLWPGKQGVRTANLSGARGVLAGTRVLDLGTFVAGPFGAVVLGDLGADVIKIESMAGDATRPSFKNDSSVNRGKRNIQIDLKSPRGIEVVKRLCATTNLVMNNFRTGASTRLGLGPQALQEEFPGLLVMECPAFGIKGPKAFEPGFDMVMQAWCGHEYVAGGVGNRPMWSRTTMVDYCGGALGTLASLAGLYHQAHRGEAVVANVPLFHGGLFLLSEVLETDDGSYVGAVPLNRFQTGIHPAESFYQASDGWLAIAVRDEEAAQRFTACLGLSGKVASCMGDWSDAEQLLFAAAIGEMAREKALALFEAHDVWAEPALTLQEAGLLHDDLLRRSGTIVETEHPIHGRVAQVGILSHLTRTPMRSGRHAPLAGEHTREILVELGYDEVEIEQLYHEKVVA